MFDLVNCSAINNEGRVHYNFLADVAFAFASKEATVGKSRNLLRSLLFLQRSLGLVVMWKVPENFESYHKLVKTVWLSPSSRTLSIFEIQYGSMLSPRDPYSS